MAGKLVVGYKAGWEVESDKNVISVKMEGARKYENVKIAKASEFIAVLAMLQGPNNTYYDKVKTRFYIKT
ncbi:hypothetical protein [Marinibactrum halimedae]|uniref:Uncharacterized protein n=1 Tax=Marinibactrum halimedae TaxID=1444977 RepID=A0AA37WNW3_9GAMM|nr:hypothetical protein [Marinibactrum halimedae]MCD9458754.1 hypothetical protein [Marinibactrum halimedae]GLS25312.1 hypothetical protein GCM10007877_10260 [Marinibactrum halimedae]